MSDEGPDTRIDRDYEAEYVHSTVGFRSKKLFNIEVPHADTSTFEGREAPPREASSATNRATTARSKLVARAPDG